MLITLKMRPGTWNLRGRRAFARIVLSIFRARDRFGTRLVHFSTQRDHAHLIVEPESRAALSRAMQGLGVRIARALNRLMGRKGSVFADRYHDRVLRTPRQVRNAIQYVLCNGRKHGVVPESVRFDPRSSAPAFEGWLGGAVTELATSIAARAVVRARTWLLTRGWRRGGLLHPMHRPGPISSRTG